MQRSGYQIEIRKSERAQDDCRRTTLSTEMHKAAFDSVQWSHGDAQQDVLQESGFGYTTWRSEMHRSATDQELDELSKTSWRTRVSTEMYRNASDKEHMWCYEALWSWGLDRSGRHVSTGEPRYLELFPTLWLKSSQVQTDIAVTHTLMTNKPAAGKQQQRHRHRAAFATLSLPHLGTEMELGCSRDNGKLTSQNSLPPPPPHTDGKEGRRSTRTDRRRAPAPTNMTTPFPVSSQFCE